MAWHGPVWSVSYTHLDVYKRQALHPIAKGTLVEVDGLAVTALEDIPQGHKMAVKPIKNGENLSLIHIYLLQAMLRNYLNV